MIAKQRKRRIFLQLCSAVPTRMNCLRAPWPRWWGTHKDLTYGTHICTNFTHIQKSALSHLSLSFKWFLGLTLIFFPPFFSHTSFFPSIYHLHIPSSSFTSLREGRSGASRFGNTNLYVRHVYIDGLLFLLASLLSPYSRPRAPGSPSPISLLQLMNGW